MTLSAPCTTSASLAHWLALWSESGADRTRWTDEIVLLSTGVAHEDVRGYGHAIWGASDPGPPVVTRALTRALVRLEKTYPDMTVRSAVGWAMVSRLDTEIARTFSTFMPAWVEVGLGETGWLFEAARMTPAEALVLVREGTDLGGVRVLAALAGATLPR